MVTDTFRNQTILAVFSGIVFLLLGLTKAWTGDSIGAGAGPIIGFGATILVVLVILRPLMRRAWLRAMQSGNDESRAIAIQLLCGRAGGFWRHWMHLHANGGDRDPIE